MQEAPGVMGGHEKWEGVIGDTYGCSAEVRLASCGQTPRRVTVA